MVNMHSFSFYLYRFHLAHIKKIIETILQDTVFETETAYSDDFAM